MAAPMRKLWDLIGRGDKEANARALDNQVLNRVVDMGRTSEKQKRGPWLVPRTAKKLIRLESGQKSPPDAGIDTDIGGPK